MRTLNFAGCFRTLHSDVPRITRVVTLDAMNTLIAPHEPPSKTYCDFAEKRGITCDRNKMEAVFLKSVHDWALKNPCFGHKSGGAKKWWAEVVTNSIKKSAITKCDENIAQETATELFEHFADGKAWKIVDSEVENMLIHLRHRGFSLAVISNFDFRLRSILSQLKLAPHFDIIVVSGELGYEKPDPKIFDVVFKHFDLINPTEMLHIGDSIRKDYLGARDYGAKSLLFDPNLKEPSISLENKLVSFKHLNIY